MNKKSRLILLSTSSKQAWDLTVLAEDYRQAFGSNCIIENINRMNYELACGLLQLVPHAPEGSGETILDMAYDINMLSKFKDVKADEKLYAEFASHSETETVI
jgi:hypothetical protein